MVNDSMKEHRMIGMIQPKTGSLNQTCMKLDVLERLQVSMKQKTVEYLLF